jgi:nucleoside-diphosphate-sugar epimerase
VKVDLDKGYDPTKSDLDDVFAENRIIIAGCQGQIGVPLVHKLCEAIGADRVLATDVTEQKFDFPCRFEKLDVTDADAYKKAVKGHGATYMVHMASILSALGERNPDLAIDVNVNGVVNALRIAKEQDA